MPGLSKRLAVRLAASHILLALGAIVLAIMVSNLSLRGRFDQYVASSIDQRISQLSASVLAARYADGTWNLALLEQLGIAALEDGFLMTVINQQGYAVWDARTHNAGLCSAMISSMAQRMSGFAGDARGDYQERRVVLGQTLPGHSSAHASPAMANPLQVPAASMLVGYWGPVYYRDADLDFLKALNRSLVLAALLALALAAVAGLLSARRLAEPLLQATKAARQIADGYYEARLAPSPILELADLAAAITSMADSLKKQELLRKQLSIDASHELRTPLAALRSRLEAIKDGVLPSDNDSLDACLVQIERLTSLSRSLERLAAADTQGFQLKLKDFRLDKLILDTLTNLSSQAAAAGMHIGTGSLPELSAHADEALLQQALENLLTNAIRYGKAPAGSSAENPDIMVELRIAGSQAVLTVSDRGIGLAADQQELVFERFYRVDPSRDRASGGFGVGLAIVREAVRSHGGSVTVRSDGPGKGCCFEIRLPLKPAPAGANLG